MPKVPAQLLYEEEELLRTTIQSDSEKTGILSTVLCHGCELYYRTNIHLEPKKILIISFKIFFIITARNDFIDANNT